jgi:hypothetical protein
MITALEEKEEDYELTFKSRAKFYVLALCLLLFRVQNLRGKPKFKVVCAWLLDLNVEKKFPNLIKR